MHAGALTCQPDAGRVSNSQSLLLRVKPADQTQASSDGVTTNKNLRLAGINPASIICVDSPDDGHERPKGFLLRAQHVGGDVGQQSRLHEGAIEALPAFYHLRPAGHGVRNLM